MLFDKRFKNYLSSGWDFSDSEYLLKQRFYLLNVVVALGFIAVGQGISYDFYYEKYINLSADIVVFFFFLSGSLFLRKDKKYYDLVTSLNALVALVYLNFLMFVSQFEDMEFVWFFFFVVTFMFLKGPKKGALWNLALFATLLMIKIQTFYPIDFTYTQIIYLIFALSIVSAITYSFHMVIDDNYQLIFKQRQQLKEFNKILEIKVHEQTNELRELNESLSETVASKVAEVHDQQEMLITQSRLAAMGEMLSMIAHQWRQPLSTTTLRISELQIKSMLDDKGSDEKDALLEEVSDTLVYLSDTIDDFQTYFKPDNKMETIAVSFLIEQSRGFVKARSKIYGIEVNISGDRDVEIETYPNELVQVLINVLNNAIDEIVSKKASEKKIDIQIITSETKVLIKIIDSAYGIEERLLERIFEPYFSTKSENGTGLGLYMAKMIVQEHMKGRIFAQNSAELGAEFCIELPRGKEILTTS